MRKIITLIFLFAFIQGYAQSGSQSEVELILKGIENDPDWQKIHKDLSSKYGAKTSDSITQAVKYRFFFEKKNYEAYVDTFIRFVEDNKLLATPSARNWAAMRVFEYGTDAEDLERARVWIAEVLNHEAINHFFLDTYANILYKLGKSKEALRYQTQAVWMSEMDDRFVTNLFKMKAGLPTWKYPEAKQKGSDVVKQNEIWSSISKDFTHRVDSAVWLAKLNFLKKSTKDSSMYAEQLIKYVVEFKPNISNPTLNNYAWRICLYSKDKGELKKALLWSNATLKDKTLAQYHYTYMDTNAHLLYKLGNWKDAIKMQEKALGLVPENEKDAYQSTLDKMKRHEKL